MKKKGFFRKLAILFPVLFSVFALSSCESNNANIKSYTLCEQLNSFIEEIKDDGTLDEIQHIWFGADESKKIIDRDLSGENGTITFASSLNAAPMGYLENNKEAGMSTDIVFRFAKEYGYKLNFIDTPNMNSAISAVLSGRADFGGTNCSITEERMANGCFSTSYYDNKVMTLINIDCLEEITTLDDLNGLDIGCCEGSTYAQYAREKMPDSRIYEYNSDYDAVEALSKDKIKAVIVDRPVADYIVNKRFFPNIIQFSQFFDYHDQYAFFFPKFAEQSLSYYANKRIGTITGSIDEQIVRKRFPEATICYYESLVDCSAAVANGKIDAYADETASFIYNKSHNSANLYRIPEKLDDCRYGFMFPKNAEGAQNRDDFNLFLYELRSSGKLKKLANKWLENPETATCEVDYRTLEGDETFYAQTIGEYPPFNFIRNGEKVGFEVELAALYAQSRHKKLEITLNSFQGILAAAESADFTFAFTILTYSEERARSTNFSDSYFDYEIFLVTSVGEIRVPFWEKIAKSFEATFITESRWTLILEGLLVTLEITLFAILFGSILGNALFFLIQHSKVGEKILKVIDYIINGMPVVVFLMIVYYIVFSKVKIAGVIIAIGVYSLLFASSFVKSISVSVNGVNRNQLESALALGYRKNTALVRFVIPQALPNFFQLLKSDITSLLKSTAIVGYIAIQDLTRMSDIIRSRTYEAFFPLITLAALYFLISFLLVFLVSRIEIVINPKRRKKIRLLKGVDQSENRD